MSRDCDSLTTWVEKFDAGDFSASDRSTQIKAGWYDWFCKDVSLRNKTYKLAPKVKQIAKSGKVDTNKTYVFFKNNCPMMGNLYDDFRICDIETGEVLYTIIPRCGHDATPNGFKSQVWGRDESGCFDLLLRGTWRDVKKFFGV